MPKVIIGMENLVICNQTGTKFNGGNMWYKLYLWQKHSRELEDWILELYLLVHMHLKIFIFR
jgi:hypothetical protein